MPLPLQDFPTLVRTQAAAVAGSARELVDTSAGSVLRALLEANASVGLWMQWLAVQVLAATRASTSRGADLDSWMADFGLSRLPAVPAAGVLTLGRLTPGLQAVVPAGTQARGGGMLFTVVADIGHPAWTNDGYLLGTGALSVDVPAVAAVPGRAGNVRAGEVQLLASAVAGVDTATNPYAFAGGLDAEDDDALRARFTWFLDSRTRGTADAIAFAVQGVRQGLQFRIAEGVDTAGQPRPGFVSVVLDDGSGAPSAALMADVGAAIEAVRPAGIGTAVQAPVAVAAAVALTVSGPAEAQEAVRAAVGAWAGSRAIGEGLVLSRIVGAAHNAHPLVDSVFGVTINGLAADLSVPANGRVRLVSLEVRG